ncbi:helix-turn-helix domain-containing protein [Kroppenstedtia eburnea]|uniref:Tetratricopeptide repeat-containing protein n=1 Tax=Kroppenstedtia eburnea TaxID=714067 RepID=A0A1N7NE60_9BACL|nr:helix-turn-helix transcriptional regulator [Kroppenstedtia eburnea]QKI83046.1 helix-turn-helix transcriptional regulator [Kroppenstedtia eburnea]SIS96645.1 Tetratricopeptide repeat-containing protein [Kroppenstedtia eburnea]
MKTLEVHDIGEIIRKVRKERGLRLEDLADENISPATISNVERGVPHVGREKALYLIKKLEIDLDRVQELLQGQQLELERMEKALFRAECLQDLGDPRQALKKLAKLEVKNSHPFASYYYYILGKCHNRLGHWAKAERALFNALRLGDESDTNIISAAYTELSLLSYYQNDLEAALKYINNGIQAFKNNRDRPQFKYIMQRNKAIYLERLGRLGEAINIVHEVWDSLGEIEQIETKLSFYWLRSELSQRTGVYQEAIQYAEAGLELARFNYQPSHMFDLWIVLAEVYMKQGDWEQAEECFDLALTLRGKISSSDRDKFITAYSRLGLLYMKLNRQEEAAEMLEKAIRLGESCDDVPRLTTALHLMGDFHLQQNKREEAAVYYRRELEMARKHHLKKKEYQALLRLAQCFENVDEQEFARLTRRMYKVQLELTSEEGAIGEEVE